MTDHATNPPFLRRNNLLYGAGLLTLAVIALLWPAHASGAFWFTLWGLIEVAPIVIPGVILAAWIIASGADAHIAKAFEGRVLTAVIAASAIGAVTPVCGVTVLPLMAGLLAAGVPLAPVMAFWLSSPITDPAMLAATAATLGFTFALGKTIAAFSLGVFGGLTTSLFSESAWSRNSLRDNNLAKRLSAARCAGSTAFTPRIWRGLEERNAFFRQALSTGRLILICLVPAFTAEYALNAAITPGSLAAYVGEDKWWAIPAAVFVGAPAYIDGYAALPLTRGLIDNGMSAGAAMAFLISGGVVSIWGAMAIFPILRLQPFLLYLALAVVGSMVAGYAFGYAM